MIQIPSVAKRVYLSIELNIFSFVIPYKNKMPKIHELKLVLVIKISVVYLT